MKETNQNMTRFEGKKEEEKDKFESGSVVAGFAPPISYSANKISEVQLDTMITFDS